MLRERCKAWLARTKDRCLKDASAKLPVKVIRPAEQADLIAVQALAKETIDKCYRSFLGNEGVDWFINGGGSDKEIIEHFSNIVVLEVDGVIAGYCAAEEGFIHILMISPQWQGVSLGAYLLAQVEIMQQAEGYEHLRLETFKGNQQALNFYQKQGWSVTREEQDESFGFVRVYMRKILE
ncbi:GNAT family N-acetyltransferase [Shewanella kaireitica]|uniref:GNAT family N-acetyltransferase n=1 Tax=Shewanella kaireitica TaxID=212021 RepID=UPI00200D67D1|nr:GNAT family N-acetyltransferase [Shewanella kaireitica]MCL1094206.1 GNAT family N-acetyltransferase [Shewanella kaireitica]